MRPQTGRLLAALVAAMFLFTLAPPVSANPEGNNNGVSIGIAIDLMTLAKKKKKTSTVTTPRKAKSTVAKPAKKKPAPKIATSKNRVAPKSETRFRRDEVLFILKPTAPETALDSVIAAQSLTRIAEAELVTIQRTVQRYAITDGRSVAQMVAALEADPNVEQAQPNYIYELAETATTGMTNLQYAHKQLRVADAHKLVTGANVVVAVIDSRVDTTHPALATAIRASYSSVDTPSDGPDGHGTAMAGAIAAQGLLMGIAPDADLLVAECFSRDEQGRMNGVSYNILKSVDWAYGQSAAIQNLSFAGPRDPMLSRLMRAATDKGVVFFAAAGNAGPKSAPLYPGADPSAIAVTAVDKAEAVFARANRGGHIAVAAPGVDVVVLAPGNSAGFTTGTSVATAHVSGLAALAIEQAGKLDVKQFRALLKASARKLKAPRDAVGAGVADAVRLLEQTALDHSETAQQQ